MKIIIFSILLLLLSSVLVVAENYGEPPWVYKGRGDRYYKNGEIGKAIVEYKKALSNSRDVQETSKKNIYPEINIKLAEIYIDEELYDLALFEIGIAENQKKDLQIPDLIYNILYIKAEILFNQKKYNKSIEVYEEIIKKDENWKLYSRQSPSEISEKFIEAPELKKKFGKAYLETGKIKYLQNHFDYAIRFFKMALMYKYEKEVSLKYLINCYNNIDSKILAEKAKTIYGNI